MRKLSTFLLLGLLMISLASAFEFDNVKSYDPITREVTITNAYGLGDEIGKARLNTPLNVKVARGYQKVAELDIWAYEDYADALKQFSFEDMKDGRKKINRDYDLKYLIFEDIEVEDYNLDCFNSTDINGTVFSQCNKIITGSHFEEREVWKKITPANLKKNEKLTIGIFTNVEAGDHIDWIPTIYGVEVEEWAEWTEALNVQIISFWNLNNNFDDGPGENNGTNSGSTDTAGILDRGRSFSGGYNNIGIGSAGDSPFDLAGDFSISFWYYPFNNVGLHGILGNWQTNANEGGFDILNIDGTLYYHENHPSGDTHRIVQTTNIVVSTSGYQHVVFTKVSNVGTFWVDGVEIAAYSSRETLGDIAESTNQWQLGSENSNLENTENALDEVGIWGRELITSEIQQLRNNGTAITYSGEIGDFPSVILNFPANNTDYTTSPLLINFSCYGSDGENFSSMGLYINGSLDQLNATGINNTNYTFSKTLTDGRYNWTCEGTDNESQTTKPIERIFGIHSITPNVTVHSPSGVINYHLLGQNLTLNWTIEEQGQNLTTHIVNCTYEYNGVVTELNNTLCTQINQTSFTPVAGVSNLTFRVTDEFGFINTTIVIWDYILLEIDQSFSPNVVEGSISEITANVTLEAGNRVSSVVLNYNGTEFTGSNVEYAPNIYLLSISKEIPQVNASTNITFFWNVTLEDGSSQETNSNNQTIFNVNIDDCSVFTNTIFNFTMVDEATQVIIPGAAENTSLKIDMTLSSEDGSNEILQFSKGYSEINPAAVCINNPIGNSTLRLDAVIEYTAADKFVEFYNIQNFVFDETTNSQNITLFNLEESEGLEFRIIYKGQDFIPVRSIVLQIQRKYIDEGEFKTVEIPMSGSNAYTIAHLVPNDVIYNLIFLQNGSILDTFTEIVADCQNPDIIECEINLNALISGTDLFNIVEEEDFFSSLTFDKTTREVSSTYGIISGASGLTSLNVTLIDNFGNNTACTDSLIAAGGTLGCTVPSNFGDSVVYARVIFDDGVRREGYISLKESPKDQYLGVLILSSIILLFFIFGIGVSDNPGLTGMFFVIGALLLVGLNVFYSTSWIGAGATILWFIVAIVAVIVKGGSKR